MSKQNKGRYIGIIGTLVIHLLLIVLFFLLKISAQIPDEEKTGLMVMIGTEQSVQSENTANSTNEEIKEEKKLVEKAQKEVEKTIKEVDKKLITQTEEESLKIREKRETKKEVKKKESKPVKKEVKPVKREVTEAQRREQERLEAIKKEEQQRRKAEQETANKVANAFGKSENFGKDQGSKEEGKGIEGSREGNSSTGASSGSSSGYGSYDLGGRKIGDGGLPKPSYNTKEEGKVVVNIVVNNKGQVIATSINPKTNTVSPSLRKAATEAAKRAIFDKIEEDRNQTGTITYFFNLR